jgi:hypothetical protein
MSYSSLTNWIIMKKSLIAAALALPLLANAGTLFTMPNKSGGQIQLTDNTSKRCDALDKKTGRVWQYAVAVSEDGYATKGCWNFLADDLQIEVSWSMDTGYQTSVYSLRDFTQTDYYARTYRDNTKSKGASL